MILGECLDCSEAKCCKTQTCNCGWRWIYKNVWLGYGDNGAHYHATLKKRHRNVELCRGKVTKLIGMRFEASDGVERVWVSLSLVSQTAHFVESETEM